MPHDFLSSSLINIVVVEKCNSLLSVLVHTITIVVLTISCFIQCLQELISVHIELNYFYGPLSAEKQARKPPTS